MAVDVLPLEEMQAIYNGTVVGVALVNVRVSCGEMSGDETEVGVVIIKAYRHGPFVS